MPRSSRSDRLAIFGSAVLFSTGGVAIKWISFGAWQVAGLRGMLAVLAVLALVPGPVKLLRPAVLLTGVAQGCSMLLFVMANKNTTAANAIFLQSAAPLYIPLLAARVLGERATKRDLAAMAGIAAGLALFFVGAAAPSTTAPHPRLGDILAVTSGFTWACTVVGLRFLAREGEVPRGAAKGAMIWGNIFVAAIALPMLLPFPSADTGDWLIVLWLGVGQVGLAYRLLVHAVARVPALEASLLALFEPVLNPLWAFLLLRETPSPLALAGAAVVAVVTIVRAAAGTRQDEEEARAGLLARHD